MENKRSGVVFWVAASRTRNNFGFPFSKNKPQIITISSG
jgi:hypothetical protein